MVDSILDWCSSVPGVIYNRRSYIFDELILCLETCIVIIIIMTSTFIRIIKLIFKVITTFQLNRLTTPVNSLMPTGNKAVTHT